MPASVAALIVRYQSQINGQLSAEADGHVELNVQIANTD